MQGQNMIETKRLKIYAASKEQMEAFIAAQSVDVLKAAYTEMLDGCLAHTDQWEWYAIWMIELKDGTHIGELCFEGINEYGSAEIGYGIADEYQDRGYATEAISICSQKLNVSRSWFRRRLLKASRTYCYSVTGLAIPSDQDEPSDGDHSV